MSKFLVDLKHMMNRIKKTIQKNNKNLVGYFMVGEFPKEITLQMMHKSVEAGMNMIELGFPFSDPTADGQTIQLSAKVSLENGTKIQDVLHIVHEFRRKNIDTPIILMGYYNIIFSFGDEEFVKECSVNGVDGLIIVDLPIEESSTMHKLAEAHNIDIIQIVSFLTDKARFDEIQKKAKGFMYLISSFGVTGQTTPMTEKIQSYIKQMQPSIPMFVGFGISSPHIAREVSQHCSGVVVGSHFIQQMHAGGITQLVKSVHEIKNAL